MEQPIKLVCPQCDLVYKVKKATPGKEYHCRRCGGALRPLEPVALRCPSCGLETEAEPFDPADPPRCRRCEEAPPMAVSGKTAGTGPEADGHESAIAQANVAAMSSADIIPRRGPSSRRETGRAGDGDLARLPGLIENLTRDLRDLDARVAGLMEKVTGTDLSALTEEVRETGSVLLTRLEEYREAEKAELAGLLVPSPSHASAAAVDIDDLADRLAAGLRGKARLPDRDREDAVDALAKLADELVKEQRCNSERLDNLARAVNDALPALAGMEEWRNDVSGRVADEIGEDRLADIVSRSIREAQRPLLREILTGERRGVPSWLFASVLLPLLLVLGYLFLPGELGFGDNAATLKELSRDLRSLQKEGVPLDHQAQLHLQHLDEQTRIIGGGVTDIHQKALEHVRNAASLEQRVKNLEHTLKERDALLKEYQETLDAQVKRISLYETRLIQLGVSPQSIR